MRKYLVLLVALAMVLGLSGLAMAAAGDPSAGTPPGISETVTVLANVAKYCSLTVTAPGPLAFTGTPGEVKGAGNGTIRKDCNTDTTLTATVTQPLTLNDAYTDPLAPRILTRVDIGGVFSDFTTSPGGASITVANLYDGTVHTPNLSVRGKLGANISSQPAGDYSGEITVTVSSP